MGETEESKGALLGGLRLPSGEITTGKRPNRSLRLRNALVARALDLAGMRVLDVGCAEGLHALYMAESATEVVGVDHRDSKIATAKASAEALGLSNVTFRRGDIRDTNLVRGLGRFDLVLAWGFLHRISDIFSLLYTLERLSDAWSFEWRTRVLPFMSSLSVAYHPPVGDGLDLTNLPQHVATRSRHDHAATDSEKIEGDTAFWEPTPGAVAAISRRLGYEHVRLLGYGESLESEGSIIRRCWGRHIREIYSGKRKLHELPGARVHMIFEKSRESIRIKHLSGDDVNLPAWDLAIQEAAQRRGRPRA